jgi:hypothetical protein
LLFPDVGKRKEGGRENEHAFRVFFCLIKGIKSKNFMRQRVGRIRAAKSSGVPGVPAFGLMGLHE